MTTDSLIIAITTEINRLDLSVRGVQIRVHADETFSARVASDVCRHGATVDDALAALRDHLRSCKTREEVTR